MDPAAPASVPDPVFSLPDRLAAKADPALIAADEAHLARIGASLARSIATLEERLAEELRRPGGHGQRALDRDQEVHRLTSRLRGLRRYGLDLCLGRMVVAGADAAPDRPDAAAAPVYIGRFGLTDAETGERLLVDWRAPAAEPFFGATHADPMGLASRRRYRWTRGRVTDYWDEVFDPALLADGAEAVALDDQSAFLASLGSSRSSRMRDVLGTIQADQDAIIRASSRGALVVDGGPGTGKTVVALHRTAYLLYADDRLSRRHGGVLFVGPSAAYLSYIDDVLPSLGEDGVRIGTIADLVPEGATTAPGVGRNAAGPMPEADARVAALKAALPLVDALEAAVRYHERPPREPVVIDTDWLPVEIEPEDWADAIAVIEPGTSHDEARAVIWDELLTTLTDRYAEEVAPHVLRRALERDDDLRAVFGRAWPLLDPAGVVADLWTHPAYLRECAPWLTDADAALLRRPAAGARDWTAADLPLLDAARDLIGDPDAAVRARRAEHALAAQREEMSLVVDDLMRSHEFDDGEGVMTMLRGADVQESLVDTSVLELPPPDALAGPFAHVVVDEAQELTDAEWRMLLRRCPSRSFTIVGDRAQARHGFAESWRDRLARVGLDAVTIASLTVNYRTPSEVMAAAEPVIRAALPDANVPTSIRSSGIPVRYGAAAERDAILEAWLAAHDEGVACVIGDPTAAPRERVRVLTPALAKGLEFDLVVLVDPDRFGDAGGDARGGHDVSAAVDRYVAMTRATQELVILTT